MNFIFHFLYITCILSTELLDTNFRLYGCQILLPVLLTNSSAFFQTGGLCITSHPFGLSKLSLYSVQRPFLRVSSKAAADISIPSWMNCVWLLFRQIVETLRFALFEVFVEREGYHCKFQEKYAVSTV